MPLRLGLSTLAALRLGTSLVSRAYLGNALVHGGTTAFTPASFFQSGNVGAWFAANDAATLFQNNIATVATTAVGQSVGFVGDKSRGYTLGPNLIVNGTFDTDTTGWTPSAGATLTWEAPGRLRVTPTNINQGANQSVATVSGRSYRLGARPSGLNRIFYGAPAVSFAANVLGFMIFAATGAATNIQLSNSEGTQVTYDDVTMQELLGNHAVQATAAARPTLRERTIGGVRFLESDGNDVLNWTAPAGTYTVAYVNNAGFVTILPGVSLSGAVNMMQDTQIVEYVAVNRPLTVGEETSLRAYLKAAAGFSNVSVEQTAGGLSIPALSVPFHLYVARDINLTTGRWVSRARPGHPTMELSAIGTPAIITNAPWAPGVPVLNCDAGAFTVVRTALGSTAGFSTAFLTDVNALFSPLYQGPALFANATNSLLRWTFQSTTTIRVLIGNGGSGGGRFAEWTGSYANGDVLQFDRPAGTALLLSTGSAFSNGNPQTLTTPGEATSDGSGTTFMIGARPDTAGVPVYTANGRVLAVFQNTNGQPLSAADRATLTAFMQGLRNGTIQ